APPERRARPGPGRGDGAAPRGRLGERRAGLRPAARHRRGRLVRAAGARGAPRHAARAGARGGARGVGCRPRGSGAGRVGTWRRRRAPG
ncbi:MAG: hypothetical protein AVDCRST_MAG35-1005, partial [uncultured Quadrisphaera sp.]